MRQCKQLANSLALALSIAFAAAACGGSDAQLPEAQHAAGPAVPPDPVAVLPASANLALRLDLARLRSSPYYATLVEWAFRGMAVPPDREASLREVFARTDVLVLAMLDAQGGASEDVVLIARGSYRPDEIMQHLRVLLSPSGNAAEVRVESRAETASLAHPAAVAHGPEASGAVLADHTWIVTRGSLLDSTLARARQRRPVARQLSPAFEATAARVGFERGALGLVVLNTGGMEAVLASELGGSEGSMVRSMKTLGARLEVDNGLQLEAVAQTNSNEAAFGIARFIQNELRNLSSNMMLRAMGLGELIAAVDVSSSGAEVVGNLRLTDAQAQSLLARLGTLLALAGHTTDLQVATPPPASPQPGPQRSAPRP